MNYPRNTLRGDLPSCSTPLLQLNGKGPGFYVPFLISAFLQKAGGAETTSPSAVRGPYGSHTASSPPLRWPLSREGSPVWKPAGHGASSNSPPGLPLSRATYLTAGNLHTVVLRCGLGCPRDWFETRKSISESFHWAASGVDSNIQLCSSKSRGAPGKWNPPEKPWCRRAKERHLPGHLATVHVCSWKIPPYTSISSY